MPNLILTDKQYQILLDLYHELNEAYCALPEYIKIAFIERLTGIK